VNWKHSLHITHVVVVPAGSILSGHGMVQIEPRKWIGNHDINTVKFWKSHAGFNLDSSVVLAEFLHCLL
jgi:hypothetical protein